jgi:hypothetical protein
MIGISFSFTAKVIFDTTPSKHCTPALAQTNIDSHWYLIQRLNCCSIGNSSLIADTFVGSFRTTKQHCFSEQCCLVWLSCAPIKAGDYLIKIYFTNRKEAVSDSGAASILPAAAVPDHLFTQF